jgi:hypothetical protein
MGRPVRRTLSSATSTPPIPLDIHLGSFVITMNVVLSPGASLTYSVEFTTDPVLVEGILNEASVNWFPVSGLDAKTASAQGNLMAPVTAVRLRVSAFTSGSATLAVIQAGLAEK